MQSDNSNTFRISRDGVYSVDIAIPEYSGNISGSEYVNSCNLWKDKLVLWTRKRLVEYDMADIEDVLNEKCPSDTPYIEFDGNILGFDVPPVIEDGSTLVPMRFLFEQMGADVEWDGKTQTATATLDNKAVTFSIDNVNARINNKPAKMDVPARLVNGKTMVPLRFLSENMGYDVDWDADSRTAIVNS
ncbi:MAG: copper amine oxidase N-terminal domain-containing protein [Hominilimicola sp.]